MEKLKTAYLQVKNHETRLKEEAQRTPEDYHKYGDAFDKLGELFIDAVRKAQPDNMPSNFFWHQLFTVVYHLQHALTKLKDGRIIFKWTTNYMIEAEIYLMQIHAFIDCGRMLQYNYHIEGKDAEGWSTDETFTQKTVKLGV